jgi:ABC-type nickel/cobalt efflux system permease component RcnA
MTWALLLTIFALGLRHGVDVDHLAAIGDMTSSQTDSRSGLMYSFLYALGHGAVVLVVGAVAIVAGGLIPEHLDVALGKMLGATLILLGFYVLYSLIRYRSTFRMRSRWMLAYSAVRRTVGWLRRPRDTALIEIEHEHEHRHARPSDHDHSHDHDELHSARGTTATTTVVTHSHTHRHVLPLPEDPFTAYGPGTALGVGAIHGLGAETPTQVLLFVSAAGVGSHGGGMLLLVTFLFGLFISNMAVAALMSWGFRRTRRSFPLYATLGGIAGVFSLLLGVSLVLGGGSLG